MLNKLRHTTKESSSKFIKAIAVVGTTLFITLNVNANPSSSAVQKEIKEVFKNNPDKEIVVKIDTKKQQAAQREKNPDSTNILNFAIENVDKYYPDMKEHLETMLNSFRDEEHKEAVTKLLSEMATNIQDPKQKIGAIILALEFMLPWNTIFSDTYDADITDESFQYIEKLDTDYKARFKWYYQRLEEKTAQLKKKLQESQQELEEEVSELEKTMQWFSPEDVRSNSSIKNLVIEIQNIYQEFSIEPSAHMKSLFDASK